MVTVAQCLVGEIRRLIIDVEVHGLRLASNLGWIGRAGWFRHNGAARARRRQRARPVLAGPRRWCCRGALACMSHAEG